MYALRPEEGDLTRSVAERIKSLDVVRGILVGGTVAVFSIALGLVLYFQAEPSRTIPAVQQTAAARPTARLPRPRPNEPLTTGSINRRAQEYSEQLAPLQENTGPRSASLAPSEATPDPRPASLDNLDVLHSRAVVVASARPDCDQVVGSQALEGSDASAPTQVFLVECANGARIFLQGTDLVAGSAEPRPSAVRITNAEIVQACEEKVRNGLAVPNSLRRVAASTGVHRDPTGDALVTFDFDATNGFGYPLALQVHCVFEQRQIARVDVNPR